MLVAHGNCIIVAVIYRIVEKFGRYYKQLADKTWVNSGEFTTNSPNLQSFLPPNFSAIR